MQGEWRPHHLEHQAGTNVRRLFYLWSLPSLHDESNVPCGQVVQSSAAALQEEGVTMASPTKGDRVWFWSERLLRDTYGTVLVDMGDILRVSLADLPERSRRMTEDISQAAVAKWTRGYHGSEV